MADAPPSPTITFLTRPGCHLCDEARDELATALAERAAVGASVPYLVEVDIDSDRVLQERYFESIPVLLCGLNELRLAMRPGAVRRFLATALDGVPA